MKKQIIVFLVLILSMNTVYPLTRQDLTRHDFDVINRLILGGGVLGAIGGWAAGFVTGSAIGERIAPLPTTHAEYRAEQAVLQTSPWQPTKLKVLRIAPSMVLTSYTTPWGTQLGFTAGEKLAIMYIARKYKVSRAEAWDAIRSPTPSKTKQK